jgi:putative proteasome-type protease
MPIDMVLYDADALEIERQVRIEADDRYFSTLSAGWSKCLRESVAKLPVFEA